MPVGELKSFILFFIDRPKSVPYLHFLPIRDAFNPMRIHEEMREEERVRNREKKSTKFLQDASDQVMG